MADPLLGTTPGADIDEVLNYLGVPVPVSLKGQPALPVGGAPAGAAVGPPGRAAAGAGPPARGARRWGGPPRLPPPARLGPRPRGAADHRAHVRDPRWHGGHRSG